ncbi:MAG: EscU/YscU/HrcU family type III secretion system export apparatus switch protein [Candidatus Baltobacteraceae bacterium]
MSDTSEKPFEATSRRIAKAKSEGNVARAGELGANLSFAAAAAGSVAIAPAFGALACGQLERVLSGAQAGASSALVVAIALVPVGCAAFAGVLASFAQNGGLAFVSIAPKFERLNPAEGLKRILSRETLAHTLRAALAFTVASAAMAPAIAWKGALMMRAPGIDEIAARAWQAAQDVALAAVAVGSLFSIAEYGAARTAWMRKLRMSFEDRKREAKEEEGDAVARGRRRSLHRALLQSGLRRVREAAFVVVNPAHVAVALEYRPPSVPVPRVVVRAAGEAALRVREIAYGYSVPIVENAPLARALYRDARSGEPIPHPYYVAVAEVVVALARAGRIAR